ncbi:MAG: hypothetical protein WAQ08_05830 [Aquabacterium sp.]|uniref:hypothetical protein n=1 Tax=Aquabacterium sp. TaxID=1872578 RepID=UPI003BB04D49
MSDQQEATAQAADPFAELVGRASAIDGAGQALQDQHQADEQAELMRQAASVEDDLCDVLKMARGMLAAGFAWWPQFNTVWNDDVLKGIAINGAAIMARHGWTMVELMAKWGPYIGLLGVTAPAAYATWQAIGERRAELEAQAHGSHQ